MGRKIERLRSGEIYNKREAEKERNQIERKKGKTFIKCTVYECMILSKEHENIYPKVNKVRKDFQSQFYFYNLVTTVYSSSMAFN